MNSLIRFAGSVFLLMIVVALTTSERASAAANLVVTRVKPNKILYCLNEPATAEITLSNSSDAPQQGEMCVFDEWDLHETREIARQPVRLEPGQSTVASVHWDVGSFSYGHAINAMFVQDQREVARAREFFQVADPKKWMRCFLINGGGDDEEKQMKADPFTTYINLDHHFAYMPSGFSMLAPAADQWVGGQFNVPFNKREMLTAMEARRRLGARQGAYTIGATAGPAGYELARQHPEWFLRDQRGGFHLADTSVSPVEVSRGIDQPLSSWYALLPDFSNAEVVRFAGEEVVRAIKMFGWESIFFDGIYSVPATFNPPTYTWDGRLLTTPQRDDASARCVREVRRIVREAYPNIALWYNGATPRPGDALRQAEIESLRDENCATLMEIQGAQIADANYVGHHWRNLYEMLVAQQRALQNIPELRDTPLACGYLYNMSARQIMSKEDFDKTRDTWTTANHIGALFLATRVHPCVLNSSSFRPTTQFLTRYSALLWSEGIEAVKEPWKYINVESNREVWWEECVSTRKSADFTDTIIGIVNSPDGEEVNFKSSRDPAQARGVEVEFTSSTPSARLTCWCIEPYGYGSSSREPTVTELKPEVDGKKLIVELPAFTYYTMVVVRERAR